MKFPYHHQALTQLATSVEDHRQLSKLLPLIEATREDLLVNKPHPDLSTWDQAISALPDIAQPAPFEVKEGQVRVSGYDRELSDAEQQALKQELLSMSPWRKGPFNLGGLHIDTEWRSDWKWDRVIKGLGNLQGEKILDVGCGSGYHLWRMLEAGADWVLGVDPGLLFWSQFLLLKQHQPDAAAHYLPTPFEAMPDHLACFDRVFSMGVLYHCRAPIDHLQRLKRVIKPGGHLLLETLIIEGNDREVLTPLDRYAAMRNVWFIPSVGLLSQWLKRAGFTDIEVVDINTTSLDEQRATEWMPQQSLVDFLDPQDHSLTREGYPAPVRAAISAKRPS